MTSLPAPMTAVMPRRRQLYDLPEARWAGAALMLFLAGLAVQLAHGPVWLYWVLYLACYATGGWEPGLAGLEALRNKTLDVDLLMVAAAIGAAAIGQVMDGGLLIVIFATSGALEAFATARTEDSVRGLLDMAPEAATRVDDDSREVTVSVTDLAVGDEILIRPGERIGADGTVVGGAGEVDQATITGEPLWVDKTTGDEVFAGTLNGTGVLQVRVERRAGESVVARIAAMVDEASRTKAKTQLFIEKIEQRYSIGMVAATVALFSVLLLWGQPLESSLLRAMTFMIVASPCAVVLATMPPLLAAVANAGRHGVLVKSAIVMEQLGATTTVAFDKTGTLTRGTPRLADIQALPGATVDIDEALWLAASAEHASEHPLARAIVHAATDRGLNLLPATDFSAAPGRGVTATVAGHRVQVGAPHHLLTDVSTNAAARAAAESLEKRGDTTVAIVIDTRPTAVLAICDQIRPESPATVEELTGLTDSTPLLMTGDNPAAANRVAAEAGIHDVRAGLLPADKVTVVAGLQAEGHHVTVVGDGVNDAPALATANVGIAMGSTGSDLTLHAADAVVVRDDLTAVPAAIRLSRHARKVVIANLIIAAAFITGLVAWDLIGTLPLPLGVAGHEGSTILVGLNGLRLLRTAAWKPTADPQRTTV